MSVEIIKSVDKNTFKPIITVKAELKIDVELQQDLKAQGKEFKTAKTIANEMSTEIENTLLLLEKNK